MNLVGHSIYNARCAGASSEQRTVFGHCPKNVHGSVSKVFFINYVTTHAVASKKRGDDSEGDPPSTLRKKKGGGEVKGKTKENIS